MRYIDFHCDTLTELKENETLRENARHLTLEGLRSAEVLVQCCSMFVPTGQLGIDEEGKLMSEGERRQKITTECDRIYEVYQSELEENSDVLRKILCRQDIEKCKQDGKIGILLTIEDGGVLFGSAKRLDKMYNAGVRLITLTWNHENEIGYPNSNDLSVMRMGLKAKGKELVSLMADKGIVVDVSHLSDGGFWNVADIMQKKGVPFVASHSNSRILTNHPRNMTDEMIKRLAECGGVMGLNLSPHFLNNSELKDGHSRIEDMVKHVLHIRNIGGSDVLAIGSDFDGIEGILEVACPKDFDKLWSALSKAGLPQTELDKMWQYNARRVLEEVLK